MKPLLYILFLLLPLARVAFADEMDDSLISASPQQIANDPDLLGYVETLAPSALNQHCSSCHGADLKGGYGVPNLLDEEWLWGLRIYEMGQIESVAAIMQTILYGIRHRDCSPEMMQYGACADTRYSEMPAYGDIGFDPSDLDDMTELVISMSGGEADESAAQRAQALWPGCTECHGEDGWGVISYGGPDLTDDVWLYAGDRQTIRLILQEGSMLECPPWSEVLSYAEVKAISVYLYRQSMGY